MDDREGGEIGPGRSVLAARHDDDDDDDDISWSDDRIGQKLIFTQHRWIYVQAILTYMCFFIDTEFFIYQSS